MKVWQNRESRTFGLTLAALSALTVFLPMYAWVLTWVSSHRTETTGTGYFTMLESAVMFGGPAIWLILLARLVYLANRVAGTAGPSATATQQPS